MQKPDIFLALRLATTVVGSARIWNSVTSRSLPAEGTYSLLLLASCQCTRGQGVGVESADHGLPTDAAVAEADYGLTWVKRDPGPHIIYVVHVSVLSRPLTLSLTDDL